MDHVHTQLQTTPSEVGPGLDHHTCVAHTQEKKGGGNIPALPNPSPRTPRSLGRLSQALPRSSRRGKARPRRPGTQPTTQNDATQCTGVPFQAYREQNTRSGHRHTRHRHTADTPQGRAEKKAAQPSNAGVAPPLQQRRQAPVGVPTVAAHA